MEKVMKKFFMCLVLCLLFVFAGCGSNSEDSIYGDDTDSTDSQNNDENADTDKTDSDNTDSDKTDSDNPDTDNPDTDNPDTDNPDTDNPDTDNPDTDNPDTDNPDTDNPDTDNPDTDNPDTDNPDTDNPDTDNPDTDNPDTDNPDTDNPDTDNPDTGSEIECTGFSLDAATFMPYYENVYIGFVENGILGNASFDDLIEVDFQEGIAEGSYTSSNYNCTACTIVSQDYSTDSETETMYFQKNGTIVVSEYDPETLEMSAEISAELFEVTVGTDGYLHLKENGACITIETGIVKAEDTSDHAIKNCAGITECRKGCNDEDEECLANCFSDISAIARTQYNNLFSICNDAHECNGNYYCLWENCVEEEEICGMRGDTENYNIPYGEVEINGTFTYLHDQGETEILYSHALEAAFVTGTFGNNNTPIVDSTGQLLSYAKIAPFKDVPTETNITLVQTYKKEEGKSFGPTVHLVTTIKEPGEYTLGLGDWTTEARIFISNTDSEGEKICDHAFGVGTINITAISWTPGATTISVNGTAKLYSYKASPHYGGDISGTEWVACDPKN